MLYPTYLLLEVLFGRDLAAATDFRGNYETQALPGWLIGLGYTSMMSTYVARGTFRDLEALRPVLRGGKATYVELQEQLTRFNRRRLWIGCLLGLAFFCVMAELSLGRWTRMLGGDWSLQTTCIVATGVACWMLVGRAAVYLIDSARLYSKIGEGHVEVDLLNLGLLSPLTRHGLRIVLLMTILVAPSAMLTLVNPGSAPSSTITVMLFTYFCVLVLATAAFVLPVRGLRRQIQARKAEELARVREDIRRNRELAAESAEASGRLPGLMAYEKRIASVREWPFDAPTLTRFFLYVAIPLGSWVGGALVERLLGAALD